MRNDGFAQAAKVFQQGNQRVDGFLLYCGLR
jgi:hypothetical protein